MAFAGLLGSIAAPLLGSVGGSIGDALFGGLGKMMGGGSIGDVVKHVGGSLIGSAKRGGLGFLKSAASFAVDKAIGAGQGAINKFARSDFISRKIPIAVPLLQMGGQALAGRLRQGFDRIMGGGGGGQQSTVTTTGSGTVER